MNLIECLTEHWLSRFSIWVKNRLNLYQKTLLSNQDSLKWAHSTISKKLEGLLF
jgi:hypothetical protein